MGSERQLGVGNDMHRAHGEHECRSNAPPTGYAMHMPFVWGRCRPNAIIR